MKMIQIVTNDSSYIREVSNVPVYCDLTVSVALHQLQLIQNSDQIAICFIKPNCSTGQKFKQTA